MRERGELREGDGNRRSRGIGRLTDMLVFRHKGSQFGRY